jgi:hypothetical protein
MPQKRQTRKCNVQHPEWYACCEVAYFRFMVGTAFLLVLGACSSSIPEPPSGTLELDFTLPAVTYEKEFVQPMLTEFPFLEAKPKFTYSCSLPLNASPIEWSGFQPIGTVPRLPAGVNELIATVTVNVRDLEGRTATAAQGFTILPERPATEAVELNVEYWIENHVILTYSIDTSRGIVVTSPGSDPADGFQQVALGSGPVGDYRELAVARGLVGQVDPSLTLLVRYADEPAASDVELTLPLPTHY